MSRMDKYIIYIHKNKVNGKVYIGQTCETLARRARGGYGYKGCPHFYNAIQEYGWDNFEHLILEENLTSNEADIREAFWIEAFNSTNPEKGYNIQVGGKKASFKGKISNRKKKVVCKETGEIFDSLTEAALWCGLKKDSASNITAQIKGEKVSAGKHPITKEPLHWYFYDDPKGAKNKNKEQPNSKKVKNLDTGEIFNSINEAARQYNISSVTISKSCKSNGLIATGKNKKLKWHWMFMN